SKSAAFTVPGSEMADPKYGDEACACAVAALARVIAEHASTPSHERFSICPPRHTLGSPERTVVGRTTRSVGPRIRRRLSVRRLVWNGGRSMDDRPGRPMGKCETRERTRRFSVTFVTCADESAGGWRSMQLNRSVMFT